MNDLFNKQGYLLAKGVFSKQEVEVLESDFDKVVSLLQSGTEDPNGRWTSSALDNIEQELDQTSIVHSHMIHRYSAKWAKALFQEKFLDIAKQLLGEDIVLHHNKLFFKPPKRGSAFPVHQDWSYFPFKNDSMIAAIIHITDATDDMGCVRVFPGSHKLGRLEKSDGTVYNKMIEETYPLESGEAMIAEPGDVLFFHYCTLHGSKPNVSNNSRKTVLVQMHAGDDEPENADDDHPYDRMTLSGINRHMTRSLGNKS